MWDEFMKNYDMSIDEEYKIEEDIEVLEKFKNNEMQRDKLERDIRCGGWKIGDIYKRLELDNAIEHILSGYKRVLKENEELENDNKYLREREKYLEKRREDIIKFFQNQQTATTIPIQKIKEKIEELKQEIKEYIETDNTGRFTRENCILKAI